MADDYSNDSNTTGLIAIAGSSSGNFEANYDNDWFKVALTAGKTYQFVLKAEGTATFGDYSGVQLGLYGEQNYSLAYSYGGTSQGVVLQYTAQASGTYYVSAQSGYGKTGAYRISSSFPADDDYAAGSATTGVISAAKPALGVFERTDDVDWFRFHADAGQITTFQAASGDGLTTPSYFSIYDSAGRSVTSVQAQAAFIAGLGGDYYVSVSASGQIGKYSVAMTVAADDYSADNTHAGTVSAGGQATGKIDYRDDADRFHLAVQAGQFYTVSLSTKAGDPQLLSLNITDGVGGYVSSTSSFTDGTLTLRVLATGTGTYSLNVVGGYYSNNTTGVAYTLKASAPEADDFGGAMGTASALTLGVPVKGKIQSQDDVDMFKVGLTAGVTYRIDMALDGSSYNYGFRMTDSSGSSVANQTSQKSFTYTPTKSGDFYLSQTGGFLSTGSAAYTLSVSAAADDYSANTGTTGRLTVGSTTKGEIEPGGGDADWYAVSLEAGGYYWFSVAGATEGGGTLGSSSGAAMRLLDASGTVLATSNPAYYSTSLTMPYTPGVKGVYYLEVASQGVGTYTVKAQVGEVDDHGNDAAHATAIGLAKPVTGKLELSTDKDMFKFTAEAGVTYQLQLLPGAVGGLDAYYNGTLEVSTGSNESVSTRTIYGSANQVIRLFEAGKAGEYYFKVGASSGVTGSYALSVVSLGKDDFPATKLTTALVEPGKPLQGNIGVADDRDWVKVHLEAGRTYVFDLQGSLSGGGTLDTSSSNAGMTLYNVNGSYLGGTDNSAGGEPRMYYVARSSGDYYLDVHGNGSKTGTYSVVATVTNGDVSAPHLLSSSIADGAVGVSPIMPKVVLAFDELVMVDGNVTLVDVYGAAVTPQGYGLPLVSAVGKTLVIDPHLNLRPGMTYTLTLPEGSVLDLSGNKLAGALSYKFTVAAAVAAGTAGNDILIGNSTGLKIDGGAGLDTVYMTGVSAGSVGVTHNTDGSYSVRDYSQISSDTLTGVERLLFSNGAIALDTDGVGGQAYRLYQAAFNRTPDSTGLGYWISAMDHGASLTSVADSFVRSQEFLSLYGATTSDADFVNLLYKNVLHRAPDAGGSSYWLNQLAHDTTRAQVLASFGESSENIEAVAKIIGNGFQYTPYS